MLTPRELLLSSIMTLIFMLVAFSLKYLPQQADHQAGLDHSFSHPLISNGSDVTRVLATGEKSKMSAINTDIMPPLIDPVNQVKSSNVDENPVLHDNQQSQRRDLFLPLIKEYPVNNQVKSEVVDENSVNDDNKQRSEPHERLNLLLLYGDDWTLKTLGLLNSVVKTPNLDIMASNGMLFTHNCVTTSICMVSRATLYTGQYASRHHTYLPNSREMFAEGVWNETLFPLLKEHGYHIGMVGKWHHPPPPKMGDTFSMFRNYYGDHFMERNGVRKHITQWNEEDALEFLENRPKDKNFALLVSFFAIHAHDGREERYFPQNKSMSLYVDDIVPTPKTATEKHFQDLPSFFRNGKNFGRGRWRGRYSTPELFQKMMKNMYRMATEVDATCGRILEELKKQNVLDKTLVIFTTDNGNLHGEHGLAEKWFPYEESIRVPLIIQDPRMPKSMIGKRNDDFTLNIDLAPTLLSAARIPVPKGMQGRDMSPLYMGSNDDAEEPWRDEFYYEWFTGEVDQLPASLALVRKDSKYIYWPDHKYEQLFRLDNDPFEEQDLYQSKLKTDTNMLRNMKKRMAELKVLAAAGLPL